MSEALQRSWTVYVDGLNFYVAVKGRPEAKWVDLRQLAERLVPSGDQLEGVKYFTSQISAKASEDPASPSRQRLFIRAARATPDIEVFEGKFQVPEGWRSMTSKGTWDGRLRPPLPQHVLAADERHFESHDRRPWKARVELPQEKFTDVAIASHLLRDYYRGDCGHAIVVSNDSDLSPAIQLAVDDGHTVGVFSPMSTVSQALKKSATWAKSIRPDLPDHCQLPDDVPVPGSSRILSRPRAWKNTEAPPKRGPGS